MSEGGVKFSFSIFRSLDGWRKFFMGRVYPAAVAALVLIGNLFAIGNTDNCTQEHTNCQRNDTGDDVW